MSRRSSGERAALYIRRLIFDGVLRPGMRVPQDDIGQTLGLSRIPVREALIALEREGWVTMELHRGAHIAALDATAVRDHYEMYGLVYGFALKRAMERGAADLVARLDTIRRELIGADDPEVVGELAFAFRAAVVAAADSPRIKVLLRAMPGLVPGHFFSLVPGAVDVERHGVTAVVRAVKRGDIERAADECRLLMRRTGSQVVQLFEERGLFELVPTPVVAATAGGQP